MASRTLTALFRAARSAKSSGPLTDEASVSLQTSDETDDFNFGFSADKPRVKTPPAPSPGQVLVKLESEEDKQDVMVKIGLVDEPAWLAESHQIESLLSQLKRKVEAVQRMQTDLPSFDLRESSKRHSEIEERSRIISSEFHECSRLIKEFGTADLLSAEEKALSHNVRSSLAMRLQEFSVSFRESQEAYLSSITGRANKMAATASLGRPVGDSDDEEDDTAFLYTGKDAAERQMLTEERKQVRLRDAEVSKLGQSITELAELFRDMAEMIHVQGSVLDRIDHNISNASAHTEHAVVELKEAKREAGRNVKWLIIFLVILVLAIGTIVLIIWLTTK